MRKLFLSALILISVTERRVGHSVYILFLFQPLHRSSVWEGLHRCLNSFGEWGIALLSWEVGRPGLPFILFFYFFSCVPHLFCSLSDHFLLLSKYKKKRTYV